MGRLRGRTREQTRHDALSAALKAFAASGFDGASLSTIADHAGVSAATLCHHFDSKRGLYAALVAHITQAFETQLLSVLPDEQLGQTIERAYTFAEHHRDEVRVLLDALSHSARWTKDTPVPPPDLLYALAAPALATAYASNEHCARHAAVIVGQQAARFVCTEPKDAMRILGVASPSEARRLILRLLTVTARSILDMGTVQTDQTVSSPAP